MRRGTTKAKKMKTENENESAPENENAAEDQGNDETNVLGSGSESNTEDVKATSQKRKGKRGKKDDTSSGDAENAEPSEMKAKRARKARSVVEEAAEEQAEEYEVEKIIDMKENRGKRHFKIHWKGYGPESETWEKEEDVNCPDLIKEFLDQLPNKAKERGAKTTHSKTTKKKPRVTFGKGSANNQTEHTEYEVAQVMEMNHKKNGKREFLVHWKGFSHAEDTWEPEENLNCQELIEEFLKKAKTNEKTDRKTAGVTSLEKGRHPGRANKSKQRAAHNSE